MIASTTQHLRLNPLDHFPPSNYNFFVSYLPLKDGVTPQEVFEVLHESLVRLFRELPWLSGKVWPESPSTPGWRPGQLEIRYTTSDFEDEANLPLRHLVMNHLRPEELRGMTFDDLREKGFPFDAFEDEQLIRHELLPRFEDGPDVMAVQANFMPGACLLVSGVQHAVSDGTSYFDVAKVFAGHCESLQKPGAPVAEPISAECSDRRILDVVWEKEGTGTPMDKIDSVSWGLLDLQRPGSPTRPEAAKSLKTLSKDQMQAGMFYVSPDKFVALRKRCAAAAAAAAAATSGSSTSSRVSGNDALTALIWRGMLKAKYKAALAAGRIREDDEHLPEARLFSTVDGRPNMSKSQALPMVYLGNLFFIHLCKLPLRTLAAPDTRLGAVAEDIRAVLHKSTHAVLQDAYTLARQVDDLNKIRFNRGHTPGSFDIVISSFLMFPYDGTAWGTKVFANGGRPYAVRPLMRRFARASQFCFVLPRKRNGAVEFVLTLYEDEMKILLEDDEFAEWALYYSF
ncbi:hypothetical protein B0H66DRAFT_566639 [Apodospora peruviana]|uniref:Trichothecene 3-O-acetyltransferase-like N-terminal domain-containing protein n=1 Tax=Apodospora peruviana TaxID=516989 RepID=A0AAE0HVC9_9PEZI|nr:hypothetical protein B0H66DRAFT_566639 [Apodospora peruviana]